MNGNHLDCNGHTVSVGDYVKLMRPGSNTIVDGKVLVLSRSHTSYIRVAYYCDERREVYSDIVYTHQVQLIEGAELTEAMLKYGDIM